MSGRTDQSKLFHAIVVVGAAMAPACGGKVILESASGSGTGSTGGTGGTGHSATSGAHGTTSAVTTPASSSSGDPCHSAKVGDCADPAQYHCVDCGGGFSNKCTCDTTLPLKPTDCKTTADFHCTMWKPPTDCHCVPGSPMSASDCPPNNAWTCESFMPPVGCMCVVPIV